MEVILDYAKEKRSMREIYNLPKQKPKPQVSKIVMPRIKPIDAAKIQFAKWGM